MRYYVIWYKDDCGYHTYATYAGNKTEAKRNLIRDIGTQHKYKITDIEERGIF